MTDQQHQSNEIATLVPPGLVGNEGARGAQNHSRRARRPAAFG